MSGRQPRHPLPGENHAEESTETSVNMDKNKDHVKKTEPDGSDLEIEMKE